MNFEDSWLRLRKINAIEKALGTILEYWPNHEASELRDSFESTACELRRRLRELEQEDMRTIEQKLQEKYEGK